MITVAHIDHTVEHGGAELALARLLENEPGWLPQIFVPPEIDAGKGAFAGMPAGLVTQVGVWQPAGAIESGILGQFSLFARALYQAGALRANRRFRDAHVVHANTSRAALIGWIACVGSSRRLVVHLRDAVDPDAIGSRNAKLLTFIVGQATGVIANSEYTLRTASPHMRPGTLVRAIPSPIGLAEQRASSPLREQVRVIGMLARITEWKGQELLVRAFADAFRDSSIILELAGSPAFGQDSYLKYLQGLVADLGIGGQVRFLGHVGDIWPLLDSWDICVHASLHSEPLGQNVLQYLAAARPTIAANSGGPTEWIEHGRTGLLFEPGSQEALASALERLVQDNELRRNLSATLAHERPVPTDQCVRRMYREFFESVWAARGSS
ncbi:glycosyltransferase family 4 protein [Mycolicibacterium mengxianglii]|uniref:glycosyltransferase family 4 protein n=1 Tax=Mycolicibacterium mengxianglii TaxID=2736649 RepID=UPI0018EEEDAF|nr:glycosyltransferase family 4 protein [Mycolicibacterium mengxianglii]